ncbi:Acyltransferase sidL [Penicillium diatomitis]|uniref:Acyltransferase sidL n=1 Tax=Penicillium diatomitis TaxID=2819901 RepID=A0A9W9WVU5_9EURO|nr:Acyltransferase sidL [Penicillium diatomitis]KAJ5477475.1 Acyltransferase sidL [Penicillium diatomitis]
MRNNTCHLPNGLSFTVTPVFGGVTFKSNDTLSHSSNATFPPGWTIIIQTEKEGHRSPAIAEERGRTGPDNGRPPSSGSDDSNVQRFTTPTLNRDSLYISYIVNPPSSDFKPTISPTRQIAMMLWATMWWYFHEPEPDLHLETAASQSTPVSGRPQGEWRVNIRREGIFKGRNLLQKLERMGLIASEDSSVGLQPMETRDSSAWTNMFVSRRSFWQIDPRMYLFTLTPRGSPPSPSLTPYQSRHGSPARESLGGPLPAEVSFHTTNIGTFTSVGPFTSASHLPTYYPPAPTQYTFTRGVRHPVRPKPPHQGEVFYVRHVPSVDQYLSFRVPFLPMSKTSTTGSKDTAAPSSRPSTPTATVSSGVTSIEQHLCSKAPSDLDMLHRWMNDPRVEAMWKEGGAREVQEQFLLKNLTSRHSFPVIGCWDGRPFGYFEIYWVKEDPLGRLLDRVENYDRGIHLLVGEQEFRGSHRVAIWLSALVHHCFLSDMRTETVYLEPRVDNVKIIKYLQDAGFYKEGEVNFPHKRSAVMKIKREFWEAPAL